MRVPAIEGYRMWAATYDTSPNPLLELESSLLPPCIGALAGKVVVDVGCGAGRWSQYAASLGARIVGVDISYEMLLQARRKPGLARALLRSDAASLPLPDDSVDVAICSFTIAYLHSLDAFAKEMARVTRSGARLVISDLHPEALKAGWKRSFRSGDQVIELEHAAYEIPEIVAAFEARGFSLHRRLEASFGAEQFEVFRRAGKEATFAELCRIPAVWIGVWRKP